MTTLCEVRLFLINWTSLNKGGLSFIKTPLLIEEACFFVEAFLDYGDFSLIKQHAFIKDMYFNKVDLSFIQEPLLIRETFLLLRRLY